MQTVGQLQKAMMQIVPGLSVVAVSQSQPSGQGGEDPVAAFDREMAKAQAEMEALPDGASAEGAETGVEAESTAEVPEEGRQVPPEEEEEAVSDEAAAAVASALIAQVTMQPGIGQTAEEPIIATVEGIAAEEAAPATLPNADVSILEGLAAGDAAEADPLTALSEQQTNAQGMEGPAVPAETPKQGDLAARMPNPMDSMIESWELETEAPEEPVAQALPGSLENEDVETITKAMPPQTETIAAQPAEEAPTGPDAEPEIAPVTVAKDPKASAQADDGDKMDGAQADEAEALPEASEGADKQGEDVFAVRSAATELRPGSMQPQAAPLPPAEQVATEIQVQQALGRQSFTMHLRPDSLGEVTVRLIMVGDAVTARIFTHTDEARQAIHGQIAQMTESLREKGIDVRGVEVLSGNMMEQAGFMHDGRQNNRGAQQRFGQARRSLGGMAAAVDAADAAQGYESLFYAPGVESKPQGVEYRA